MLKGLFINSKAEKCSIHQSGKMIYNCLKLSNFVDFDYIEIDPENRTIPVGYDLYYINYHWLTMQWLDIKKLREDLRFLMTVVLEVLPNDPFPLVSKDAFDIYCAIDPTMKINNKNVYSFPRPLDKFNINAVKTISDVPVIGSFGLPTPGKGFEKLVEAVNKEFDSAIIRINLPLGDFVSHWEKEADDYEARCKAIAKKGIDIQVTHDFMSKQDLISWCAQNTINCFFYDRNQPGLAATTDQAISSGAPLLTSDNETFRHITHYIKPYPQMSIKEAIEKTPEIIKQIQKDWSQEEFAKKFDEMIEQIKPQLEKTKLKQGCSKFELQKKGDGFCIIKHYLFGFIPVIKLKRWVNKENYYFLGIPILKIKKWPHKKKFYFLGLPVLKGKIYDNKTKYYLFGFLSLWKINVYNAC